MVRTLTFLVILCLPFCAAAGERVAGTNSYVIHQQNWHAGDMTYWRLDNAGTFDVSAGPLTPGFVRCIGAGFGSARGVTGEGICIFGKDDDTFTWHWEAHRDGPNTWEVIDATGKYRGMTGSGRAITRVESEKLKIQHRVTDWEGEIDLPIR